MTDMYLWNTPIARLRGLLVAALVLGVALFVVTTTQATSAKQPAHHSTAGPAASHVVPAAPAGPRGPITLTCGPGGAAVVGAAAPAGPQGPVGVNCAAVPNG